MIPDTMNAMVLEAGSNTLRYKELPVPRPGEGQVLVKIHACGICRTDLHIMDRELPGIKYPIIPGHEIIGTVVKRGAGAVTLSEGQLVGIPWLGYTCGKCKYCLEGRENLCDNALFTGYTIDGGYAEYTVAYEAYCFPLPGIFNDLSKAPLLCAGLIGYRSYTMKGEQVKKLGLYGFGAAAHILVQVARQQGVAVYAFTKDGDTKGQEFARKLGAVWAGDSSATPPQVLDAAIIFAPAGDLVPKALKNIDKGRTVVCGGIHMSDIPSFPYSILWGERCVRTVANLTRRDANEFLVIASEMPIITETQFFPLEQANEALAALRKGSIKGAAVLTMARSAT